MPLVCRSFREAALWCWQEVEIDGLLLGPPAPTAAAALDFWQQVAAWVHARAPSVRALRLHNLRHLLRELGEEQRRDAVVGLAAALAPPSAVAAAVTHIELGRSSVGLGAGTLAGLARLASLRSLVLHTAGPLDTSELDAVGEGLPLLEELVVCLMRRRGHACCFRGPFPLALCHLRHLRVLRLEAPNSALHAPHCVLPDAIAAWGPQVRLVWWVGGWEDRVEGGCFCVDPIESQEIDSINLCIFPPPSSLPRDAQPTLHPPHPIPSPYAYPQIYISSILASFPPTPSLTTSSLTTSSLSTPTQPTRPHAQMKELHLINLGLSELPPAIGALTVLEELW